MHSVFTLLLLAQISLPIRAAPLHLPTSLKNFEPLRAFKASRAVHKTMAHHRRPDPRELPAQAPIKESSALAIDVSPKLVFAHFIVGNTYPYQINEWSRDIQLASSRGIDAFALNVGPGYWQRQRVADAYSAAQQSNTNFKLFLSFDMTVLPCSSDSNAGTLRDYINMYATHPNQQHYHGKVLVSTFSGEHCTFGQSDPDKGWTYAVKAPHMPKVHFIPSFFVDPKTFPQMSAMDGQFNWNSGWPTGFSDLTFDSDDEYLANLHGKTYMAAVSPWFFTVRQDFIGDAQDVLLTPTGIQHYSPQTYNKNWIYRSDDWLWASRWETLITKRSMIDIIEVISWNDYGESHYIGPIEGAQPNSQSWVDGMDHQPWNDMMEYYIQAFKTGTYPDVDRDRIVMWARLWPAKADAANDPVGRPTRWEDTEDAAWAVIFATSPATVILTCSSMVVTTDVPSGVSKLKLPLVIPGQITASMTRKSDDGSTGAVLEFAPAGFEFKLDPMTYNFNALVVASP